MAWPPNSEATCRRLESPLTKIQTLIGVQCPKGKESNLWKFVGGICPHVRDASFTLQDRRAHREARKENVAREPVELIGLALSFGGLLKLTPGAAAIESKAFRIGMLGRSELLGDPTDPSDEGHPS
jgi:hypothetical protein